jgi:hypothetical protein
MTRFDETWHRLREWTLMQAASERLAAQILLDSGYKNVDPIHPLGGPDGGKDAIVEKEGERWIMAAYFPRGQHVFEEIAEKFKADLAGVERNDAVGMAFVTNQELKEGERRRLRGAVDGPVDLFHLERVATILDQPHMAGVRKQFLDIDFGAAAGLGPSARLEEMKRASLARCVQRWRAVGLPQEEARALAEDHLVGLAVGNHSPSSGNPVVVWTAKIGAGKSIAAERVHQAAVELALEEPSAPIPVFVHASAVEGDLAQAIVDEGKEVGEVRRRGANVVIDGLDEVGYEVAEDLLGQARVTAETWPSTTVLLTSRPMQVALDEREDVELPPLSEAESHACIELGAGRPVAYGEVFAFPATVKETLHQPLFALLAGLWMRQNEGSPRAPVDLMGELGEKATPEGAERSLLRRLAVASVRRDLGSVPVAEVVKPAELLELLASGIVSEEKRQVVFALPALAQWFAAEALLEGEVQVEDLLAARDDLELWLYPLALTISFGSYDDARRILDPLLEGEAGFAFRVLDTAFKQAVLEGADAPPWREAGEKIRGSLVGLRNALDPLQSLITDSNEAGALAPMAVATHDHYLTVAFSVDRNKPELSELPTHFDLFRAGPEWGSVRGSRIGPGGTWAWRWSREVVKDGIKRLLKARAFPVSLGGPLADEEAWACATEIAGESNLVCTRLQIAPLIEQIVTAPPPGVNPPRVVINRPGRQPHDLVGMLSYLLHLRDEGHESIEPPIPLPDRLEGGTWIGELYSSERLIAAAETMYLQAIQAYCELVDRWLPRLASSLEHRVLMPIRVVGRLNPGEGGGWQGIPTLAGHLEALPFGVESEVSLTLDPNRYDYSLADGNWEARKQARPEAKRWLRGTHGGMTFELGQQRPVADIVYNWLSSDLQRLGLADALDHSAGRDAMTLWDLDPLPWKELVKAAGLK